MEEQLLKSDPKVEYKRSPRKWTAWLGLLLLAGLCGYLIPAVLLPRWIEGQVRSIARSADYFVEWDSATWSLYGVEMESARLAGEPFVLSLQGPAVNWKLRGLREGTIDGFSAELAELQFDLLGWWPPVPLMDERPLPDRPPPPEPVRPLPPAPEGTPRPALPEPEPAGWWTQLPPVGSLQLPDIRLLLRGQEVDWALRGVLQYYQQEGQTTMESLLYGEDFDLEWGANLSALPAAEWSARARFVWDTPAERLKALVPPEHPLHPDFWMDAGASVDRLSRVSGEWLAQGQQDYLNAWSGLLEGDFTSVRWLGGHLSAPMWMLAVGGEGRSFDLQAGLSVDFWQHHGWMAENFQLVMERSKAGRLKVETPDFNWRHTSGWNGSFSARFFSDWPELFQPVREGELQIAFHALSGPWMEVHPFRFFLNLEETAWNGRMSVLESPRFPGWSLANTRLHGEQLASGGMSLSLDTVLEHASSGLDWARLQGRVTTEEDGVHSGGTVRDPGAGTVLATWSFQSEKNMGTNARLAADWDLTKVLPWLRERFSFFQRFSAEGALEWNLEADRIHPANFLSIAARFTAFVNEANVQSAQGDWSLEGANGALRMEARPFPRSIGLQMVQMDRFQVDTMSFDEVEVVFSWPMFNRFRIERANARIHGGSVQIDSFHFDPREPSFGTRLVFASLDTAQAVDTFPMIPAHVTGPLDGVWSIHYRNGRWMCGGLVLRSKETGWLFQGRTSDQRHECLSGLIRGLRAENP